MGKDRPQDSSPSLLTSYSNRTEGPSTDGVQCGRWILRSTCVRRRRRQPVSLKFEPSTPTSKRKRRDSSSPTPSANSFTGENSVQVYYTVTMGGQKFYVVFKGRNPGIYNDWPSCSEQVNRFSGAVHKKYTSWDEAYNAWVTFTRQVADTAPPSLLPLAADPSGSSTNFTQPARDWFGLGLILAMVLFLGVVVAIILIMVL